MKKGTTKKLKIKVVENNALLVAKKENGFINFYISSCGVDNIRVDLVFKNSKLKYKIYKHLGGK